MCGAQAMIPLSGRHMHFEDLLLGLSSQPAVKEGVCMVDDFTWLSIRCNLRRDLLSCIWN